MFGLLMALSLLMGTLLQAHLPGISLLGGIRWPILISIVLYYALNHRGVAGALCALGAGLLMDCLSFVPIGFSVLFFCLAAWLSDRCRQWVLPDAVVTSMFFGGLSNLLYAMFLYILLLRNGTHYGLILTGILRIFGSGLLGALTAPVVFFVLSRLHKSLDLGDKEENAPVEA